MTFRILPEHSDTFADAEYRILLGHRKGRDSAIGGRALTGLAGVDVKLAAVGVGTDTPNLVFAPEIFMGDSGGDDEDIAG